MKRVHVVGRKNHGKTTLIVDLVRALTSRGLRVGTIKSSLHAHELDKPGTDTHRQRTAGAAPAAIVTSGLVGIWRPRAAGDDDYAMLAPLYADTDLVLVEGDTGTDRPKIEVWRAALDPAPMAMEDPGTVLLVTDDPPPDGLACPVRARDDLDALVAAVLDLANRAEA